MKDKSKKQNNFVHVIHNFRTSSGWTINHNPKSDRFELNDNREIKFSDVNSQVCKNVAEQRHQVDPEKWKISS